MVDLEGGQEAETLALLYPDLSDQCRYRKAADWSLVTKVAKTGQVPIIGNGEKGMEC